MIGQRPSGKAKQEFPGYQANPNQLEYHELNFAPYAEMTDSLTNEQLIEFIEA